jgi:predicted Rossmann fold flavoprotein
MIGDALAAGRRVEVDADVVVDVPVDGLDVRLREALAAHGRQSVRRVLREFVPDRLAVACCGRTGVDPARQAARVSAEERRRLVSLLKGLRIPVRRCRPLGEAMVTAGGVDTRDLDPRTLMSRRVTGLFFAGEVIDVDGDTGGFNLQAAFSTGWLAGRRAAEWVRRSESGIAHSVGAVSAGLRIPDP